MSSGYVTPPSCTTCNDSDLVVYCSACKRRRCPKCNERKYVGKTEYGEMCNDCFITEWSARIDRARGE